MGTIIFIIMVSTATVCFVGVIMLTLRANRGQAGKPVSRRQNDLQNVNNPQGRPPQRLALDVRSQLAELKSLIEELSQAQQQPLSWFVRRMVGTKSEKEAVAILNTRLADLSQTIWSYVAEMGREQSELLTELQESQQAENQLLTEIDRLQAKSARGINSQMEDLRKQLELERGKAARSENEKRGLEGELRTAWQEIQDLKQQVQASEKALQNQKEGSAFATRSLQKQLEADTLSLKAQLQEAKEQAKKLADEKALFIPPERDYLLIPIRGHLKRLFAAKDKVVVNSIELRRNSIHTLSYSSNPAEVSLALIQYTAFNEKIKQGGKQVLGKDEKDMLLGFATVLGYYNFYLYLLQIPPNHKDSQVLQKLCDLSFKSYEVAAAASNTEAVAWLAKHLPPQGDLPGIPCSFTLYGYRFQNNDPNFAPGARDAQDREIAQAIIELEKQNLLDFRKSLFMAAEASAPQVRGEAAPAPGETEEQEQSTSPQSPSHQFRVIRFESDPELADGRHIIQYEYSGPFVSVPVMAELAFNNAGEVLIASEEDE